MFKKLFFSAAIVFVSCSAFAQAMPALDKSPMAMAYYPNNFAHDRKAGDKAIIRITYGRPARNGREIFGKQTPYDKVWRLGANEASEIKFYQDVQFGGKMVKAGTYSLFAIPGEKEWTIILNSDLDYWGAYSYKQQNDVLRVTAPVTKLDAPVENFTILMVKAGDGGVLKMAWDNTMVELPFK